VQSKRASLRKLRKANFCYLNRPVLLYIKWEYNKTVQYLFIDFKKVYDYVMRFCMGVKLGLRH
jgi:hypothetical protein